MALSVTTDLANPGETVASAVVTFDAAYPAGGEAVTAADFGLSNLDTIVVVGTRAVHTWHVWFNPATSKLVVSVSATGVEAGAVDLSTLVVDVLVYGG